MEPYETRQTAWWAFVLAGLFALLGLGLAIAYALAGRAEAFIGLVLVGVALLLANFGTLTVRVNDDEVRWFFGHGWIGKRVPLARVHGAAARRSPWYWGWGIRWTPRGWLWRSSGLDAVWLELGRGREIGVGTDDPEGLARAIRSRAERSSESTSD